MKILVAVFLAFAALVSNPALGCTPPPLKEGETVPPPGPVSVVGTLRVIETQSRIGDGIFPSSSRITGMAFLTVSRVEQGPPATSLQVGFLKSEVATCWVGWAPWEPQMQGRFFLEQDDHHTWWVRGYTPAD